MVRKKNGYSPWYNTSREYENKVNELRVKKGMTCRELGEMCGVSGQYINELSLGKISPLWQVEGREGEIKPFARKLSQALGAPLHKIFPREVCGIDNIPLTDEMLNAETLSEFTLEERDPAMYCERINEIKNLIKFVKKLRSRERTVVRRKYFLDESLGEIAEIIGASRERVRQIELKAIRKVRLACGL